VRSTTAPYTESRLTRSVANERVGFPVVEHSLTSCIAHFISIEGSSVRLGYSRNIPHSVLQCLCLG
jgi:hypothetical protein